MIDFSDIRQTLNMYTFDDLVDEYEGRRIVNSNMLKMSTKGFLNSLNFDITPFMAGNPSDTFRTLIAFINKHNTPSLQEKVKKALEEYKYKNNGEIILLLHILDMYFEKEMDYQELEDEINMFFSISGINKKNNNIQIESEYGTFDVDNAYERLYLEQISKEKRRGQCHHITSWALLKKPNLYGAYIYVPMDFSGKMEHSVVIDQENDRVYDLAHGITIPYDIFRKYNLKPSFVIKGSEFQELQKQVKDTYNEELYMHHLEEIRRIRKK